jgi:hypothetical protein
MWMKFELRQQMLQFVDVHFHLNLVESNCSTNSCISRLF